MRALIAAALLLLSSLVIAADLKEPVPATWNPMRLERPVAGETVQAYQQAHAEELASAAYLYALPLFLQYRQRYQFLSYLSQTLAPGSNPVGQWMLLRQPASPKTTDVFPNHDTLYGATFLELAGGPVVVSVPAVPARYYSLALHDAWFYHFDTIGSRTTGQKAGNYLIAGPNWKGSVPAGIAGIIRSPSDSMHIYLRIYFRNSADIPEVTRLQDGFKLTPLARFVDPGVPVTHPDSASLLSINPLSVQDPLQVFAIANRHMGSNVPPVEDKTLLAQFSPLGVGPGLPLPEDEYRRNVLRRGAVRAGQTMAALARTALRNRNGWLLPPIGGGKRGSGMALHAMNQLRTIGLAVAEEATYYTAYEDAAGRPLHGDRSYRIRFAPSDLPPLLQDRFGFWSITLYDRVRSLFVANSENKYALRSGDDLIRDADGGMTLIVQAKPPADLRLRTNWLPAPAGNEFVLMLRVYLGGPAVVAGTYLPPSVVAQAE